ncbi:cytochrome P450 [Glomus cerebriforme]|uniref:Cytochrome P450 n=1 Tax=Glomus cerebriforme TaxID=658196 RepID=A0A397SR87_9GLOM|nr:cytochrome P450 [Glomus cerebriforme]
MSLILNDLTYSQLALGSLILLLSFILLRSKKHSKLNEPPLVPYKYPIIGHTIDFNKDSKNFIKKCQAEYGEIFSLYVYGRVITYVGKELTPEVFRNNKDFNFNEATQETFPLGEFLHRTRDFFNMVPKIVQVNLSGELKLYTERVQKQLNASIDEIIGNGKVLDPPLPSIQFIIAKPIAATLVGEDLSDDRELVNTFAYVTSELGQFLSAPPTLGFVHPSLHRKFIVMKFNNSLNNPYEVHRGVIKKRLSPVIEKRLSEMKRLGDKYIPPIDILQRYIEMLHKDYTANIDDIMDHLIVTIFASVHTTSVFLTYCLHELVNNPQFHKEILEEQEQIYSNNKNPYYSTDQIAKMVKLDSFIKETMRIHSHIVSLQHKTLSSYYTFSNGYQVPKGRFVYIRTNEIHFDEELQGKNSNEFDAFRYLNKNSPATRVERNHLIFGLGKHACPGRVFAINEIKIALHYFLLNYNIRAKSGKKIEARFFGAFESPSNEGLIFEKRT